MSESPRPSDDEAAHAPNEGNAVRDQNAGGPQDQLATGGDFRPGQLSRADVLSRANQVGRDVTTGNSGVPSGLDPYAQAGTDANTAGARAADALPDDVVQTPAASLTREQGGTSNQD